MSLKLKDTVQANSSTSSKLLTARNFKIGNTSRSFNGSADVTWTLSDIGAAASSHTHSYLPLTGGTLTGSVTISTDNELIWNRNTDYFKIGFKNTGDSDTDSYGYFKMGDNGNEYFKWQYISGSTTTDIMTLKSDGLRVNGTLVSLSNHTHSYAGSSSVGGVANSAAKWSTARTLTLSGSVTGSVGIDGSANVTLSTVTNHTHDYTISIGRHNEAASGDTANSPSTGLAKGGTKGLYMTETYNDSNTPSSYGNIINISGSGTGQLLCEWSGSDTGIGHLYYRSHRDTSTGGWRPWITILDSNNVGSFACTKSQYDAIISRLNSIDSQLSGVSTALTSLENAVK